MAQERRLWWLSAEDKADIICHERTGNLETLSEEIYNQIYAYRSSYLRGDISLETYQQQRQELLATTLQ